MMREQSSPRGAVEKAQLEEVGFHHIFKRVSRFGKRGGYCVYAHWPATKIQRDTFEVTVVQRI